MGQVRCGASDELLAPNYHNPMMGGTDRAGFKALLPNVVSTWRNLPPRLVTSYP